MTGAPDGARYPPFPSFFLEFFVIDSILLPTAVVAGTDATDDVYIHNYSLDTVVLQSIGLMPKTSVSTHASNYITTTCSVGGTTVATHTTNSSGGSALTAGTLLSMTLSGTGKQLEIASGSTMRIQVAKAGTGPTYSNQIVAIGRTLRSGV